MSEANAPGGARPLGETIAREGAEDRSREPGDLPPTARPITPSWKGVALNMTYRIPVLAALATTFLALSAPASHAATVNATVRVEGQSQTLLPTTPVTLDSTKPVVLADKTCPGDSAAAALDQATRGNWDRKQFTNTILGETHKFDNNDYWAFWFDEKYATQGICDQTLTNGDRVLALVDVSGPPPDYASTVYPIAITGAPASANRGATAAVTVVQYDTSGKPAPLVGATVSGGAGAVTTGADGRATVTFDRAGQVALRAVKASERSDVVGVCVHEGDDGTCGTTAPASGAGGAGGASSTSTSQQSTLSPSGGRDLLAPAGRLAELEDGHVFGHGKGPRLLKGTVGDDPSGLLMVKLRLTMNRGGTCGSWSSKVE